MHSPLTCAGCACSAVGWWRALHRYRQGQLPVCFAANFMAWRCPAARPTLNRCLILMQVTEMQQRSRALELSAVLRQQTWQLQESEQHQHDLQQQVGNLLSEQQWTTLLGIC